MDKEQQDLIWSCMSKTARDGVRKKYQQACKKRAEYESEVELGRKRQWDVLTINAAENCAAHYMHQESLLTEIFGKNNLLSDTEPDEVLLVKKETITKIYEAHENVINGPQWTEDKKNTSICINGLLKTLFGNQCWLNKDQKPTRKDWVDAFCRYAKEGQEAPLLPDYLDSEAIKVLEDEENAPSPQSDNCRSMYNALCELETASQNVRRALISFNS